MEPHRQFEDLCVLIPIEVNQEAWMANIKVNVPKAKKMKEQKRPLPELALLKALKQGAFKNQEQRANNKS